MRIFISYGRRDAAAHARELAAWLRASGHEPWLDVERGVPLGAPFDLRIEMGISGSRILVGLLSPSSLRPDGFCRNELLYAQALNVPIIPVRVAPVVPPIQIISLNYVDALHGIDSIFPELSALIADIAAGRKMASRDWTSREAHQPWWAGARGLDFTEELAHHGGTFTGRTWVFEDLAEWLAQSGSGLCLLTADAGLGKSAIAAQSTARLDVRGVHFCSRSNIDSCRPEAWLSGLIYQLGAQLPPYRQRIETVAAPRWTDPPDALFRTLVADPLRACRDELDVDERAPWLFVVDGLDESVAAAGPALADLLADSAGRLPPWVRLVVTSRPDRDLIARFRTTGVCHRHISSSDDRNLDDLAAFVERGLSDLAAGDSSLSAPGLARKLREAAAGNFLFAKVTLDAVAGGQGEGVFRGEDIGALPTQLGGLYYAMFKRRFAIGRDYEELVPLLDCLVAARDALPEELLLAASSTDEHTGRRALLRLSQFLRRTTSGVVLFHASLAEWLADPQRSGGFAASARTGHRRLAEAGWREFRAGPATMSAYGRRHFPVHFAEALFWDRLLALVASPDLGLLAHWVEGGDVENGQTCLSGLVAHLAEDHRRRAEAAGLATQLARIHILCGRHDQAESQLAFALAHSSRWNGRRARAIALHELGSLCLYQGRIDEAARHYRAALRLCRWGIPVWRDEAAGNLAGLATVALRRNRLDLAARLAESTRREAIRAADPRHEAAAERLLGGCCQRLGRYDEARRHLDRALALADACGSRIEKARALLLRAHILYDEALLEEKLPDDAEPLFREARREAENAHDLFCVLDGTVGLLLCTLARGATGEALSLLQETQDRVPHGTHPFLQLRTQFRLMRACLAHRRGDREAAALYLELSSPQGPEDDLSSRCKALVGLGSLRWHAGDRTSADSTWKEALRLAPLISPMRQRLARHSIDLCRADPRVPPR